MPSFVYSCEQCSTELRFMISCALEGNLCIQCPKCEELRKFNLAREGNVGQDWCSKLVIKNKRRRDDDGLYNSESREQSLPAEKVKKFA